MTVQEEAIRMCGEWQENVAHLVSACYNLAQRQFNHWGRYSHDNTSANVQEL